MDNVRPARSEILVKLDTGEKKVGKVFLPDTRSGDFQTGTIVGVGPDVNRVLTANGYLEKPLDEHVRHGQQVVLRRFDGAAIRVGEHECRLMPSDAILAFIDK